MTSIKTHLYFLFILILLNHTAFSDETKSSNCGSLLTTVMKYDPEKNVSVFEEFHFSKEEFCDLGTNEVNANFDLQLFDKANKMINQKNIFLNTMEIHETLKPTSPTDFETHKFAKIPQYRVVKFALLVPSEAVATYKIKFKKDNKVLGAGPVVRSN